jgi:HEAT repeat protein
MPWETYTWHLKQESREKALTQATRDPYSRVREASALSLGQTGTTHSIPRLLDMLSDLVPAVISAAANALGRLGDERSAETGPERWTISDKRS